MVYLWFIKYTLLLYKQPKGVVNFNKALGDNNEKFGKFWCVHMSQGQVAFNIPKNGTNVGSLCVILKIKFVFYDAAGTGSLTNG